MSAVIDLDNATKGVTAFSRITIWGGVKGKRLPRHRCGMTKPDPSTDDSQTQAGSNGLIALSAQLPHHPVVLEEQARRAADIQLRIADWITAFAGSMNFVYLHVVLFTVWMLFIESKPWPTLTLVVSLEAIFLSTFVMIGQNRQAGFQQAKADHDFNEQELELKTNTELTREIHRLTTELHTRLIDHRTRQEK
jgi:uncharacterized membrane protein